jgi:hypothetical protein
MTQTRRPGISTVSSHRECRLHSSLTSAPDVGEWSRSRPGGLALETEPQATDEGEAWWAAVTEGRCPASVSEPRTVELADTG